MTRKKGKRHETRADLKAEGRLVIDVSKIEVVVSEDMAMRTAESMARIARHKEAPQRIKQILQG
jgi:hypothetical protein